MNPAPPVMSQERLRPRSNAEALLKSNMLYPPNQCAPAEQGTLEMVCGLEQASAADKVVGRDLAHWDRAAA